MIACIPANGLFFLVPGLLLGITITLVVVLRRLWLDARDDVDDLVGLLNDQHEFIWRRGIHWGWWDNQDPWRPASEVADSADSRYPESASIAKETS